MDGVLDAFTYAYPRSKAIKDTLSGINLKELSAKRNVIVHNNGLIDEEYCSRMNENVENVGKRLVMSHEDFQRLGQGLVDMGVSMLKSINFTVA